MGTLRGSLVLFFGLCWVCGCAAPVKGPDANMVPPAPKVSQGPGADVDERGLAGEEARAGGTDAPQSAFCDGKPIERVEEHWEDGGLRFRQEVVIDEDGSEIPHGLTTTFWPNGKKKLEMEFNCGVRHGARVSWREDETLWSTGEFFNGKDHGLWTVWYPGDAKAQEFTMHYGAWHGVHTVWYPNGQKRMEVAWVNGKRQGPLSIWDEEGDLIMEQHYVDNVVQPTPMSLPPSPPQQDPQDE